MIAYFLSSFYSMILHATWFDMGGFILNILALLVEMIGPIYSIYFLVQLVDGMLGVGEVSYDLSQVTGEKKVAVIVPIHNVVPDVLKLTLQGLSEQDYPNFEVWIADDSTNVNLRDKAKELTLEYGFTYYFENNKKLKAGMINLVLPKIDAPYIAFFDVDHVPTNLILKKFVAILEQHDEYAFVQAKYGFRNNSNLLHVYSAMFVSQLFCSQNARRTDALGTVLFQGSSACFRQEFIHKLPEGHLIEDFAHTINLISKGKQGYYLDEIASMSLLPETIEHQISQTFRWTTGHTSVFSYHVKEGTTSKMRVRQALDLFFSATLILGLTSFYFLSIIYAFMYGFKMKVFRAAGLDHLAIILLPVIIFTVYLLGFTATTIYFKKSDFFPLKLWHAPFFLIFAGLISPFMVIAATRGIILGGYEGWNKKLPLIKWATIFSFFGLIFSGLGVFSFLDFIGVVYYYDGGPNYFWMLFFSVGFTLLFVLPFILFTKYKYKTEIYEEENIYH